MNRIRFLPALLLMFLLAFGIVGCANQSASVNSTKEGKTGQENKKSGNSKTPESQGKKLVDERCTKCHNLDRIQAAHHDRAGWENTVARMVRLGAKLNKEERQKVIDYLSSR
jgi:cytochrome c5